MAGVTVEQMAGQVADLMEARLRIRGDGLAAKLRKGGRFLPRKVRREAEYLLSAQQQAGMPKLRNRIDQQRVASAYDACIRHLKPLGADRRRKAIVADMVFSFGTAILATIILVIVLLVWRGFL